MTPTAITLNWKPANRWHSTAIPTALRAWLTDAGSLTAALIAESGGEFGVEILRQDIGRPRPDECNVLGLKAGRQAMIREVILMGRGEPWVYARSILPLTTLTGRLRALRHLDSRPLGALLFSDQSMTRAAIEIARIPAHSLPEGITDNRELLWGRRSVFFLDEKPLLVSETFLPGFRASVTGC